jgi:hypothetical protein
MPASYSAAFPQSPDSGSGEFVRFTFPVTWSFLSRDPNAPQPEPKPELKHESPVARTAEPAPEPPAPHHRRLPVAGRRPEDLRSSAPKPPETGEIIAPVRAAEAVGSPGPRPPQQVETTALQRTAVDRPPADHAHGDRWEMVIPKMSRPVSWSSRKLISESPKTPDAHKVPDSPKAAPSKPPPSRPPEQPAAAAAAFSSAAVAAPIPQRAFGAPAFGLVDQKPSPDQRKFLVVGASSLTVLLIVASLFLSRKPDASGAKDSAPVAVTAGAPLIAGAVQWTPLAESPRRLSIVRGSTGLTDFRMSFQVPATAKAAGWIVRAADNKNYYAIRLEITNAPGGSSSAILKRFAVIDGIDQPVMRLPVAAAAQPGSGFKVRTEAVGNKFATWIGDRQIDQWADVRLGTGGVGVYNERGESPAALTSLAVFPLVRK